MPNFLEESGPVCRWPTDYSLTTVVWYLQRQGLEWERQADKIVPRRRSETENNTSDNRKIETKARTTKKKNKFSFVKDFENDPW